MSHAFKTRSHGLAHLVRVLLTAFAIACQVAAVDRSALAEASSSQAALLADVSVLCQGAARHQPDDHAPSPHQHMPAPAVLGVAATDGHAALLHSVPVLPAPAMALVGQVVLAGARAPPDRYAAAAFPRGPPLSV